jgi:hypothetical protein
MAAVAWQISTRALQPRWALILGLALLVIAGAGSAGVPYEIGGAQREVGRIRELAERLSKQNLLYQLHLADQRKQEIHDTAAELDRILELLQNGSATYYVAAPPNAAIREQIQRVGEAWAPLRRMAVVNPYAYLRQAREFMPRQQRLGDPLFINAFDHMSQTLIAEADRLMALYVEECLKTDYELCPLTSGYGSSSMLTERMAKELVFVYAGLETRGSSDRLRKSRDTVDAHHRYVDELPIVREAMDPSRGDLAKLISALWGSIEEDWGRLRREVDLALAAGKNEIDLKRALKIQARLVESWERLTVAIERYVNAKYGG